MLDNIKNEIKLFLDIAELFSKASTCDRKNVGAIITKNNKIIGQGYNRYPKFYKYNCNKVGHIMHNDHCIVTIHAEQAAIYDALNNQKDLTGCLLYVTHKPCYLCMKNLLEVGIRDVFYMYDYDDENQKYFEDKLTIIKLKKD